VQLNRTEARHDLARAVFHGRRGDLYQAYRSGQEDQLGALGLVVECDRPTSTRATWIERSAMCGTESGPSMITTSNDYRR